MDDIDFTSLSSTVSDQCSDQVSTSSNLSSGSSVQVLNGISSSTLVSSLTTSSSSRPSRLKRQSTSINQWPIEATKKAPPPRDAIPKLPPPEKYTITKRGSNGEPTMAVVDIPGLKTNPPIRVLATIGLDNIDVQAVLEMCVMNSGRFDYRIKFHHCLLTREELVYMTKAMRYTIIKEYKTAVDMVDEYEDGEKVVSKRYLLVLQNEWMDYTRLIQFFPNAKGLLQPANERWASEPGPIVPVKASYARDTLIAWYPY